MRITGLIVAWACMSFFPITSCSSDALNTGTDVYVCMGSSSKRFHHDRDCQGLRACKSDIEEMPVAEARELGRTLCGYEK